MCNGLFGAMLPAAGLTIRCSCRDCMATAPGLFTPTHWEQHCGKAMQRKWRVSIRVAPGGAPEVPAEGGWGKGGGMPVGKWLDLKVRSSKEFVY